MLRTAIFGLGGAAERIHLPACRDVSGIDVVAACEPIDELRRRVADRFSIPHVYEDAETLLAERKPDLVIVGTPPDSHHALCRAALEAGAHVLCEKPFTASLEEADDLLETARRVGRMLRVNNQYRYMPIYSETRRRIEAGDFGELFAMQAHQQMFHPPEAETVGWRKALKRSTLYEFGTHALDLICYLFDDFPEAVSAHIPKVRDDFDSDVLVQLTLRFPDHRLATMWLNRVTHGREHYLDLQLDCEGASLVLALGGVARASVEWSRRLGRPTGRFSLVTGGKAREEAGGRSRAYVTDRRPAFASATARHLRVFARQIEDGELDEQPMLHARRVLELVFAAYESAESGETVRLPAPRPPMAYWSSGESAADVQRPAPA